MTRRFNLTFDVALLLSGIIFLPLTVVAVVVTIIGHLLDEEATIGHMLGEMGMVVLFGLGVTLAFAGIPYILGQIWAVTVTPETIRASTYFGLIRTIRWSSITSVAAESVSGSAYLVLDSTDSRRRIWIPRWMIDEDELFAYIGEYVDRGDRILEMIAGADGE